MNPAVARRGAADDFERWPAGTPWGADARGTVEDNLWARPGGAPGGSPVSEAPPYGLRAVDPVIARVVEEGPSDMAAVGLANAASEGGGAPWRPVAGGARPGGGSFRREGPVRVVSSVGLAWGERNGSSPFVLEAEERR